MADINKLILLIFLGAAGGAVGGCAAAVAGGGGGLDSPDGGGAGPAGTVKSIRGVTEDGLAASLGDGVDGLNGGISMD